MSIREQSLRAIDLRIQSLAPRFQASLRQNTSIRLTGKLKKSIRVKVSRPAHNRWIVGLHMEHYGYILHNQSVSGRYKTSRNQKLPKDGAIEQKPKKYQQIVELFFQLEEELVEELSEVMANDLEEQIVHRWSNVFGKNISL